MRCTLEIGVYKSLLREAGFADIDITRRYTAMEAGLDPTTLPAGWESADGALASAGSRASKGRGGPLQRLI